jgi:hypothetical protein
MPAKARYAIVGVAELALLAALAHCAKVMAPAKDGSPREFWMRACGVGSYTTYTPRDGWFIYFDQGFHGQFLYRVRREAALAAFPDVFPELEAAAKAGEMHPVVVDAYRAWSRAGKGPEALLEETRSAWFAHWEKEDKDIYTHLLASEQEFGERWRCVNRYWVNILFEFAYLTGVLLFVAWPWLFGKGLWRWALHIGLFPLLLFLPYFLGYALATFTSAGPSGGALYPWLLVWFWPLNFWTRLDTRIYEATPLVLLPISQPLGPMLSLTCWGFGRVAVGVACLLFAAATVAAGVALRAGQRWLASRRSTPENDTG